MKTGIFKATLVLMMMFLFTSCDSVKGVAGKAKKLYDSLTDVQTAVSKTVDDGYVTVTISNSNYLNIGIVNSKLKDLPDDQKKTKAREIAQVAYDAYASKDDLKEVSVVFGVNKSYIFFHYSNMTDATSFEANDLKTTSKALLLASPTPGPASAK